jgi:cardiolipin-specific phospholipase
MNFSRNILSTEQISFKLQNTVVTEAHVIEEEILKFSGLELYKDLHVFDVPIDFQGKNYIHTYSCGDDNEETLVLVHGYAGCSLFYYSMLKDLSKKYRVYCIDLLGMGLSSKPGFDCKTPEETIEFFVGSIEKWREALGIEQFCLAGHSFGGYMSVQYSLQYQNRVKKLFLLSPVGVTKTTSTQTPEEIARNMPWGRRQLYKLVLSFWENRTTPGEYYKKHPYIGKFLLKKYLTKQFGNNGKDEKLVELLLRFYIEQFQMEGGSDKAIHMILQPPRVSAKIPLEDLIKEKLNMPIVCFYGDNDWMDKAGSRRIAESGEKNFKLKQIGNSGHQITMHNPKDLSEELLLEVTV